jgi:hypothetical protein
MNADRRSAIDLIEEAIDLLRRAPARGWAGYLGGAVPFWSALLIFWARMTGNTEVPNPTGGALLLALLFGARQFGRAYFGHVMYESLAGREAAVKRRGFVIAWFAGLARLPLLIIPAPLVIALFRNLSILSLRGERPGAILSRAVSLAGKGGEQAAALLTMIVTTVVVWINVYTGMVTLPMLFQLFTGQQTVLMRNTGAIFNGTTTLASVIVTWLIADLMLTAFYTLRVFYGESEDTGADLIGAWRHAARKAVVAALLLVCCLPAARAAAAPKDLNQAIDRVLAEPPYQWRQPLPPADQRNGFVAWTDHLLASISHSLSAARRELARFMNWLRGHQPQLPDNVGKGPPPIFTMRLFAWLVIVLLAGALAALLLRSGLLVRRRGAQAAALPAPPAIDLDDPSLLASQLPEDEWIALARDFTKRGDHRMALRAWFLANLSFLGSRELLTIGRSRTNLDYLRELHRRARSVAGLEGLFAGNVRSFENVWYGRHPVAGEDVTLFAANFERMRSLAS